MRSSFDSVFASMDAVFNEVMSGAFTPFSDKTLVSYPMRFGWYYRRSTQSNEFWWGGTSPMVIVADEHLMAMPQEIISEVGNALNAKGEGAYLD